MHREADLGEALAHAIAAAAVLLAQVGDVVLALADRDDRSLLHRRRDREGQELVRRAHAARQVLRRRDPPDLPPRAGEALAKARHRHGALGHARERREVDVLAFEEEVLVDLVGEDEAVVPPRTLGDRFEFAAIEDAAGRVVRRVDEDRAGLRRARGFERLAGQAEVGGFERHVLRDAAGHRDRRGIAVVEGRDQDDFVAGVHETEDRRGNRLGAAARHGDLAIGIEGEAAVPVAVGKGVREPRGAAHAGVLVEAAVADRGARGVLEELRRREVREPLPHVHRAVLDGERAHLGEDRRPEGLEARRDLRRRGGIGTGRGTGRGGHARRVAGAGTATPGGEATFIRHPGDDAAYLPNRCRCRARTDE